MRMRLRWSVNVAARVILGAVLISSAAPKIVYPGDFYTAVVDYGVVGGGGATVIAAGLPWLELTVGLSLLTGIGGAGAMVMAALMMLVFTGLHGYALIKGLDIPCGCFGVTGDREAISGWSVTRNGGLLTVALLGWWAVAARRPGGSAAAERGHSAESPPVEAAA